jgi:hypothetical protein
VVVFMRIKKGGELLRPISGKASELVKPELVFVRVFAWLYLVLAMIMLRAASSIS